MVATIHDAGTLDGPATGAARTPGAPAGLTDGSMVLGIMVIVSNVDPAAGTDFTKKYSNTGLGAAGQPSVIIQWRRNNGGAEPAYSWPTGTSLSQSLAIAYRVEGEDPDADPFFTSASAGRDTAISVYPTTSLTSVPAGSTLIWVGAASSNRSIGTGPSGFTRLSPNDSRAMHIFKLEDYSGGNPSVSGIASTGGSTSLSAMLFVILPAPVVPNEGSASLSHSWDVDATGETAHSGSATISHAWDVDSTGQGGQGGPAQVITHEWTVAATGETTKRGSAAFEHDWFVQATGPQTYSEYVEDWADLNDVVANGVSVLGNRLYSGGSTGNRGYTKAFSFPADGVWRHQQLIYNEAGTPAPTIKLGFSCGDPNTGVVENDPDAIGIVMEFSTRARDAFKGSNLSSVTILDETIVGVGPTTTEPLLFTIDATPNDYSFALKAESATRAMISFRIARSDLADAGKAPTKLFAFIQDSRTTSGSSLSPFIYQTGTLAPTVTKTVAGQLIEGRVQHILQTKPSDDSPFTWWIASGQGATENSPWVIHIPQSLTGDGNDMWTDVRMEDVTRAIVEAGFGWASSTDTTDRFANQVELDNYVALKEFAEAVLGTGRDIFLFGTSMGTMAAVTLIGKGLIDARASQTLGFAGGFDWLWNEVPEKRPEIQAAYGVASDGSDLREKTTGFDPLLDFIGDVDFDGVGFRFNTGTTDDITPTALSDDMSAIVLGAGATEGVVTEYPGGHLDIDQYQGDDLVAFYLRNLSVPSGSASISHAWDVDAAGEIEQAGSASVAHAWDVDAVGQSDHYGAAAVAHVWAVSASGEITRVGSALISHLWDVAAQGTTERSGSATVTHAWDLEAVGDSRPNGSAELSHSWTVSAAGRKNPSGSASLSHLWHMISTSGSARAGFSVIAHSWAVAAQGVTAKRGSAEISHQWSTGASGGPRKSGDAAIDHSWAVDASGSTPRSGSAVLSHDWEMQAVGAVERRGAAEIDSVWAVSASGEISRSGSAEIDHEWVLASTGGPRREGSADMAHQWSVGATGFSVPPDAPRRPRATVKGNFSRGSIKRNSTKGVLE